MRIAILDDCDHAALAAADWKRLPADCEVTVFDRPLGGVEPAAHALAGFDVVVGMRERTPFPAGLRGRLPVHRLLVTTSMRNRAIDAAAARARGAGVCGTRMEGYAAFEHAWALVIALFKQIPRADRMLHAGGWQSGLAAGLAGKTLGVLGLGRLGSKVARVALAFDMRVLAWSANLTGHTGYVTAENYALAYGEAIDDIDGWRRGEPVRLLNG